MSLHITKISLIEIALPLREPFQISSGAETTRRIFLLYFESANGLTTWSECVAGAHPNYLPETIDTAWLAVKKWLAPQVVGKSIDMAQDVSALFAKNVRGHYMAKAALEMAVWALFAQLEGKSLAKFIGGTREKVATGISLGIQKTPNQLLVKVSEAMQAGYQRIKMKIKPDYDTAYVRAVRDELGYDVNLMVDANNAYSLNDTEILRALDAFELMMIEQPLAWDDIWQHHILQQALKTPICLDESITHLEKAREMVALNAGRIINIKPGRVGGFSESVKIHDFCKQNSIPVWCGGMLESGIGRAYNVALASLSGFSRPGDISPSSRYWEQDIVAPEWNMDSDGFIKVPFEETGLGVEIDLDRVDNLTVRRETIS